MSDEIVDKLAERDSAFLEKFLRKTLKLSEDAWAKKAVEDQERKASSYPFSFRNWHQLRLMSANFEYSLLSSFDPSGRLEWEEPFCGLQSTQTLAGEMVSEQEPTGSDLIPGG